MNDENKYGWIKTTPVENDFSMFKGDFKYLDSVCMAVANQSGPVNIIKVLCQDNESSITANVLG